MVLSHLYLQQQQNKENALLRRSKVKHSAHYHKSHKKSSSKSSSTTTTAQPAVTRKPRSRSHLPHPHSSTPSPVLIARKHAVATKKREDGMGMDVDMEMIMDDSAAGPIPSSSSSSSKPAIQLPRMLKRPTSTKPIDIEALQTLDPELKNVPLDYVIDKLRLMGRGMLQSACSTTANPPSDRLPRELQVTVPHHNNTTSDAFPPPSHVFAVYARENASQPQSQNKNKKVTLHPAHGIVLAAHCANLPPLPSDNATSELEAGAALKLPIIPLSLPSPNTFPLLLAYLYTKQPHGLFNALLPPTQPTLTLSNPSTSTSTPTPSSSFAQSPAQLAQSLAQTYTTQALLAHAARVHGLWANIVALGVNDDEVLWKTVQFVWAVLIMALEGGASS